MQEYVEILEHNYGFKNKEKWLAFAKSKNFKHVKYKAIDRCPDCGSSISRKIGQFIYYSTLHSLLECKNCNIWYVDVLIDEKVRNAHFEVAYKSENYFKHARKDIFLQTLDIILKYDQRKSLMIELGGATGELCVLLKNKFPNSRIILNDISKDACDTAKSKGIEVIEGSISSIIINEQYSAIIALDVLYYEPEIKMCIDKIYESLKSDGILLLRLPNKYNLINVLNSQNELQSKIHFFNPEHLYVFTRKYLKRKLETMGYKSVEFLPSRLLRKEKHLVLSNLYFYLAMIIYNFTGIIITPSFFVVARK